ncbi:MAG: signal peptidase II [Dissulfurimicrobium sp.]|uniref:signal peptidase II n=1 Tax=Dissulfurimicrobium sp. TaxID=2022436 RepID=UPI00404B367F
MNQSSKTPSVLMLLLAGMIIVILDQTSKIIIISHINLYEIRPIIPNFFNLTYLTNTGAAFGFMAGTDKWRHIFFQAIALTALGGLIYLYKNFHDKSYPFFWGCALIFGGALGNLIDRMRYRYVIDFLDFHAGIFHWPAFNVADSAITVGGALLAWHFLRTPVK